jgi:hypothetical protein
MRIIKMKNIIAMIFGDNQPAIDHFEVKFYTGGRLNDTWDTHEVHETAHGYSFIDTATGNLVTVGGEVKVTAILASNVVAPATTATPAADPATPAA